jgi:gliding-associated putative ABC transporter substrate-binding component GldG
MNPPRSNAAAVRWLSSLGAALVFGILVFANLLSSRFYARLDFSDERLYSLSDASKRVLGKMDAPIEARLYFSAELPPEYATVRSYVRDLLEEYEDASRGRFRARFVDVDASEDAKREAAEAGITPVQFNVISREKFEVREGYMGLVLQRETVRDAIPVLASTEGLEYDLTSRILQISRARKSPVGIVSSHGAIGPEGLSGGLRAALERAYELVPIDLAAKSTAPLIPNAIDALLLLGPAEEFDDRARFAIDRHLMAGKAMTIALDPRRTNFRSFLSSPGEKGLREQLKSYGVKVDGSFVLDRQNRPVQIAQTRGFMTFTNVIPYPLFVVASDLDPDHPVTRHLDAITFPFAAPLSTTTAAGRFRVLARSSDLSWQRAAWRRGIVHSVNPLQELSAADGDPKGPFALAMSLQGPFRSFFSGEGAPDTPDGSTPPERSPDEARLIVAGTARIASPDMPVGGAAAAFLLNAVDWMSLDEDLIAIRSKGALHRPLREIPPPAKTAVRWINILLPGFLAAGFGAFRFSRRRSARARRKRDYATAVSDGSEGA